MTKIKKQLSLLFVFFVMHTISTANSSEHEVFQVEIPKYLDLNSLTDQYENLLKYNNVSSSITKSSLAKVRDIQSVLKKIKHNGLMPTFGVHEIIYKTVIHTQSGRGTKTHELKEIDKLINSDNSLVDVAINENYFYTRFFEAVSLTRDWDIKPLNVYGLESSARVLDMPEFEKTYVDENTIAKSILTLPDETVVTIGNQELNRRGIFAKIVVHSKDGRKIHDRLFAAKNMHFHSLKTMQFHPLLRTVVGVGSVGIGSNNGSQIWLFSFDPKIGLIVWSRKVNVPRNVDRIDAADMEILDDGSIVISGTAHSQRSRTDVFVSRINLKGKTMWSRICGGLDEDIAISSERLLENGVAILSVTNSKNDWSRGNLMYPWLLILDSFGYVHWEQRIEKVGRGEDLRVVSYDEKTLVVINLETDKSLSLTMGASDSFEENTNWNHDKSFIKSSMPFVVPEDDPYSEPTLTCVNLLANPTSRKFSVKDFVVDHRLVE